MAQKILLIEDDQFTRAFYQDLLTQEGYEVVTAKDGAEGLAKILAGGYSLILLDIVMPKLDGLAVLKKLQTKKPKSPNGPIIVLTVVASENTARNSLNLGAVDYLIKTDLTPKHTINAIRKHLPLQKANRSDNTHQNKE